MRLDTFGADFTSDWRRGPIVTLTDGANKKVTVVVKTDWQATELYVAARMALVARRDEHAKAVTALDELLRR